MATSRCSVTGLAVSTAYKQGDRCDDCKDYRRRQSDRTDPEKRKQAAERSREWRKHNPERSRAGGRKWAEENPDRARDAYLHRTYGISLDEYNVLFEKHDGNCHICKMPYGGLSNAKRLHVDHCHETDRVRGLLCGACNVGLGHFKDDVDRLRSAIQYIQEHGDL